MKIPPGPRYVLPATVAVAFLGMAVLTFADVIGRYFLNAPIPGAFEIVGLVLGFATMGALPLVTFRERHITVDLLDGAFRGRLRRARRTAVRLGTAAATAFMAERLLAAAADEWASDFVTENLGVTRAPLLFLMAALCAVAAAGMLIAAIRGRPPDSGSPDAC